MFVIIRTMKIEKGYLDIYKEQATKKSLVANSKGFVKREVLVSTKHKSYDVIQNLIYFENKKAYYVWQGSPEHIAMHKNKKHDEKPEGLISITKEEYELIKSE